jgi:hypothetical protein
MPIKVVLTRSPCAARGTGQPPGACGGPRNSCAPCLKRARRKVPVGGLRVRGPKSARDRE